jgi:oxygen-dependent protoporphyrinogen oxidase
VPITIDCAVIGGGIAGLSAAHELGLRGLSFRIFEAGDRVGGLVRTDHLDGFTIDQGPDSLLAQKPAAVDLCRELGLADRLITASQPRVAYVLRAGILHPIPEGSVLGIPVELDPLMASQLFSTTAKERIAGEPDVPARREESDESIGEFVRRRFGGEACEYIAEPLLAGIHAGDVDRLSIEALFPQLPAAERRHGSVVRAFRSDARAKDPDGAFRSLVGGLGDLIKALATRLPAGSIETNWQVTRFERDAGYTLFDARGRSVTARSVVVATPTYVTSELFSALDRHLSALLGEIEYASSVAIALAYPRSAVGHALNGTGFVIPRVEGLSLLAVTWTSSKWPGRAPADHVLLRSYVGDRRSPDTIGFDDNALVDLAVRELTPILDLRANPLFSRVYRWPRANAQYEIGHLSRVRSIERRLAKHPGLFLTGSGLRGVGIPDCVADGRATARQVAAWLGRPA